MKRLFSLLLAFAGGVFACCLTAAPKPSLSVSPSSLDFGEITVGDTSRTVSVSWTASSGIVAGGQYLRIFGQQGSE